MGMPFAGKVTDQLLLFRVNADNRIACGKVFRFEASNVFELGITVRMCPIDFFLRAFLWPSPCFFNNLRTVCRLAGVPVSFSRRLISQRDRLVHKTPSRIGSPAVNSARIARKLSSSWVFWSIAVFRPPPFFSAPIRWHFVSQIQFLQPSSDRFRINVEEFRNILHTTMTQFCCFDTCVSAFILFR